jgi:sn-glycerol 3-phosphate transport system permease protein
MIKRAVYKKSYLPYLLVLPQLIITVVFFFLPAAEAIRGAFYRQDVFGLHQHFVWFDNFKELFESDIYLYSFGASFIFAFLVTVLSIGFALLMAVLVNRVLVNSAYKTLLIWPYAVAPAIAGVLWRFLFDPSVGSISWMLHQMGYNWNFLLNGKQAMFLVVIAASWQQFSYNFIFFLAGLAAIPKSLIEASAIDGAGPFRRFWTVVFPLLSPTTFFLLSINLIYAFFQTFGVIATVTEGGPANATNILVYKVYYDAFYGLNIGSSNAQSVILMGIVLILTVIQFKYIERKVHY